MARKKKATIPKPFLEAVKELSSTVPGQERNMYPLIKRVFQSVGWKSKNIKTDVSIDRRGAVPDVAVIANNRGAPQLWIVAEAKATPGMFKDPSKTEELFNEKKKYLNVETEWFLFIDPTTWRVVPVVGFEPDFSSSKVFNLPEEAEELFTFLKENLSPEAYSEKSKIEKFLNGDTSSVGVLNIDSHREEFFQTLEKSFQLIFEDTKRLVEERLLSMWSEMEDYLKRLSSLLKNRRDIIEFNPTFTNKFPFYYGAVKRPSDWEEIEALYEKLKRLYSKSKLAFRLLYDYVWLPERKVDDKLKGNISFNSAILLLSRLITVRFLEDYSFLGRRFFSNGGIKAFREVRKVFNAQYTELIRLSANDAKEIFPTIVEETVYDWPLDLADSISSKKIENILYWLSFFNFSTIKEDILSQLYTKMVSPSLRKKLGQVFTPPWVADYIVKRIIEEKGEEISVLDPACGSGTFLVSFFEEAVGKKVRQRKVYFTKVKEVLSKLHGNDIDTFATTITKLQLTWHLLDFKEELLTQGFPILKISTGDAIATNGNLVSQGGLWSFYDTRTYDAVIGNPPYVRPEIRKAEPSKESLKEFGEFAKKNLRTLFTYKALKRWLDERGILGFVLPLSILDSEESKELRELFKKEYTIKEIVDLELAAKCVFPDVAVIPLLLIVEKKKPKENDKVIVKFLEKSGSKGECPANLLKELTTAEIPYSELFLEEEEFKIATKVNLERLKVIRHLQNFPTFEDIARRWWKWRDKKSRKFTKATLNKPKELETDRDQWVEQVMIARGLVFRRQIFPGKWNTYKGENILPCQLIDVPSVKGVDVTRASDPSFWKFPEALPEKGFAFMQICLSPTACPFNPREIAFEDTVSLFFPKEELKDFPFDFLVLSNLYRFYYLYALREGVVLGLRSHLYPRTLKKLPWSEKLRKFEKELKKLRSEFIEACKITNLETGKLIKEKVELTTVMELAGRDDEIEFRFSEKGDKQEKGWYTISNNLFDWVQVNNPKLGELIEEARKAFRVNGLTMKEILELPVPKNEDALKEWKKIIKGEEVKEAEKKKEDSLKRLNQLVYAAFSVSPELVKVIEEALNTDFAKATEPPEPFTERNIKGRLESLESADRYTY